MLKSLDAEVLVDTGRNDLALKIDVGWRQANLVDRLITYTCTSFSEAQAGVRNQVCEQFGA